MMRFVLTKIIMWICMVTLVHCIDEPQIERLRLVEECCKKENFSLSQITELKKRNFEEPVPQEFKCWVNCFYEKYGVWVNGALAPKHEMKLHLVYRESEWDAEYEKLKACDKQFKSIAEQPCERAYKVGQCVLVKTPTN